MYKKIKTKKGEQITQASGATALIALIVGLIVLYFIFLPPDERAKILDENEDEEDQSNDEVIEYKVLLLEYPGRIDYLKEKTYEHDISSFYLYKTTNAREIHSANPFIVRKGLFDEKKKEIKFTIDDLENTDNVMLSFSLNEYRGILSIMLNGQEVFEGEISTSNPNPLKLDKKYLDEENILEFSVSGTGIMFWSTNVYSFSHLKIVADVTDISRQEGQNTFFISENEKLNMEKASLRFWPNCNQDNVGKLEIMINYHQVSSNVPDCQTWNIYSFSPSILESGDNEIIFKTAEGSYRLDNIRIDTSLKEITYPTYYFEINESLYKKIQDDTYDVKLSLEFVDDKRDKNMDININNRMSTIDTKEAKYYKNIDRDLKQGNNFI
ncbi:MAG: hypothetical protein PHV16_04665 [Candidatus Nanoarchaeia archaeon]|nr:hypothetical protein [Candidatus Nanoarchaeia archaeon]